MEKILFRILVAVGIYLLFLISRTFYLWWKYIKERNAETKFVSFLKKDDTLRDLSWILPIALGSAVANSIFRNNINYEITIFVLTCILGIYFVITAFRKEKDISEVEEIIIRKKLLITILLFAVFTIEIFWSKYLTKLITPLYSIYLMAFVLLLVLSFGMQKHIRNGKSIKTIPGFYYLLGLLFFNATLILLNWIYS
ncbi:MAG: hypothetical protein Q8L04_06485 [Ignavibacteria bacterium]|nr:hypothetical protein [Ignavibacteria bacterium]